MNNQLYFVAIIPPPDVCDIITAIKLEFRDRFGSGHALRLMPHITLKAPFSIDAAQHRQVLDWFEAIKTSVSPFQQALIGFNCFRSSRNPVIFIQPLMNPSLQQLQRDVIRDFEINFPGIAVAPNELAFHPHVTVGYRDLPLVQFKKAWQEYKDKPFDIAFRVDNFCLLQHDKKQWNILARTALK